MAVIKVGTRQNAGVLEFFDRATGVTIFSLDSDAQAVIINANFKWSGPTTDPHIAGEVFSNEGILTVSTGPS